MGGTSKLPGMVEFTKETLQLPARLGTWKHITRVVDGLDEQRCAPVVGLMLLDMLLGSADSNNFEDVEPGILQSVSRSLNRITGRFKQSGKR